METYKFLKLFRLEKEELIIGLLHENLIIKKNLLPEMVHLKAKLKDFKHHKMSDIRLKYKNKVEKELDIFLTTQNLRDGRAVFFIVNPGGTKHNEIKDVRSYFGDIDFAKVSFVCESQEEAEELAKKLKATGKYDYVEASEKKNQWCVDARFNKEEIEYKKRSFKQRHRKLFEENLIVETYAGFHIYFLLASPEATDDFSDMQKAIARKFEGDPSVNNLPRAMRLPGFYHMKYEEPYEVKVINWPTKRWTKDEIINTYKLEFTDPQTAGVVKVQKTDVNPYTRKKSFYTREKVLNKPNIVFKKPSVPVLKREKISLNLFIDEVRKKPFTDLIQSPSMDEGQICCPFHNDTNPSAGVFITRDGEYGFKCFTCEAGFMNIIGIYRQTNNVGHIKAVHALAAILGYEIMETEFEKQQFQKYRLNRRFLTLEDIETFYPNIWYWIKPTQRSDARFTVLEFMNSYAEATLVKDEFQHNGEQTTFMSFHHLERRLKKDYSTVYRTVKLLILMGFFDLINNSVIHPELKKTSEKQREVGLWREKEEREKEGKTFDESKYREISYYSIPLWEDRIEEIEKMAEKLREVGFTIKDHLNKKGIALLFGDEMANKLYQDERTLPKKTGRLFDSFNKIVVKEIQEKGYFPLENIVEYKIRVTEEKGKQRYLNNKEKLKHIKEFLSAIKEENNFTSIYVEKQEKKEFYGVNPKIKGRTIIILPMKN